MSAVRVGVVIAAVGVMEMKHGVNVTGLQEQCLTDEMVMVTMTNDKNEHEACAVSESVSKRKMTCATHFC